MSGTVVGQVLKHSTARHSTRLVLIALAERADPAGYCWPSVEDIASAAGVSRASAYKALKWLAEEGEIRIAAGRAGWNSEKAEYWVLIGKSNPKSRPKTSTEDGPDFNPESGIFNPETEMASHSSEPPREPPLDDFAHHAKRSTEVEPVTKESQVHRTAQDERRLNRRNGKGRVNGHVVSASTEPAVVARSSSNSDLLDELGWRAS